MQVAEEASGQLNLGDMYSDWGYVQEEIARQQSNEKLKTKLRAYWGETAPPFLEALGGGATAIFCRPLATPNFETKAFTVKARSLGLRAVILEFPDRFVTFNMEKRALWMMAFRDSPYNAPIHSLKLFDAPSQEGRPIQGIDLKSGCTLPEFHWTLFDSQSDSECTVIDMSVWFSELKDLSFDYYSKFMAIFVVHGVWFENLMFHDIKEGPFISNVIWPAFCDIQRQLGVKPLLYRFLPPSDSEIEGWLDYPTSLLASTEKLLAEDKSNHPLVSEG